MHENELVDAAAAGDERAFEKLVKLHSRAWRGAIARILSKDEDIDDALQSSMLKIFQKLGTFRGEASFKTWSFAVCLNEARMQRRTDRKHAKTVICVEEPLALELTYESSAADYVEAKQLAKLLIDSVAYSETLTETLVAESGCASPEEQQRVMNLSNSAARTRMRRIRENLTAATIKH